jgi:ribosome-associated protein
MNNIEFKLVNQEYIELHNLLKVLDIVNSGGEAKVRIRSGEVLYNGEVETRKRKKLYLDDTVKIDDIIITIR